MNQSSKPNNFGEEKWLSMSEASSHTPYSAEYLSLLARKGKLASKKVNGVWYTTKSGLDKYMQKQMLRAQVLGGGYPTPQGSVSDHVSTENPSVQSDEVTEPLVPKIDYDPASLKRVRSLHADVRAYMEKNGLPLPKEEPQVENTTEAEKLFKDVDDASYAARMMAPEFFPSIPPKDVVADTLGEVRKETHAGIEKTLEKVLDKKFGAGTLSDLGVTARIPALPRKSWKTVKGSRVLLGLTVILMIGLTTLPVPFIFSAFERSADSAKSFFTDANTVMGLRPGTHQNEILLLDQNGDVVITGHIETGGQLRSHIADGTAPIVVDSKTMVKNLNAELLDGASSTDFTLAFVTKNGSVTTENVKLLGSVELGSTQVGGSLLVKGATKLLRSLQVDGDLSVFGNAEFKEALSVLGPAHFSQLVVAEDNLEIGKNASVRGSVTVGSALLARSGSFGHLSVSDGFSAKGEIKLGSSNKNIIIEARNITLDKDGNQTIAGTLTASSMSLAGGLSVDHLDITGTATSTFAGPVLIQGTLSLTGITNLQELNVSGTSTLAELLVSGSTTLGELTFTNAVGGDATTTSLFSNTLVALVGRITSLVADDISVGALTATSSNIVNSTSVNSTSTNLYAASAVVDFGRLGNASTTNLTVANNLNTSLTTGSVPFIGASGLLTQDNSNFYWDNTLKRLGIGTTSPSAKLSVAGDGYFNGNLTASGITATGTLSVLGDTSLQNLTFGNATGTSATTTNFYSTTASSTNLFSSLLNVRGTALVVGSSGNVGIGTASPRAKLDVNGVFRTIGLPYASQVFPTAGVGFEMRYQTDYDALSNNNVGGSGSSVFQSYDRDVSAWKDIIIKGRNVVLSANSSGNLALTGGNVGIGTTTPTAKLDVQSSGTTGDEILVTAGDNANIKLQDTSGTHWAQINSTSFLTTFSTAPNNHLRFAPGGTTRLSIQPDGNVGIGSTTPAQKLSVAGNTYITGGLGIGIATTTSGALHTTGNAYIGGSLTVAGSFASSITNGQFQFLANPVGTGIDQGTAYINPVSAGTNNVLLGIAVNGVEKARIDAEGDVQIVGLFNSTNTTGTNSLSGNLSVLGNTTLGDSSSDTLTINAGLASNIIPDTDLSYNLGSPSKRFGNIYTTTLTVSNLMTEGSLQNSFIINSDNATFDTEDSALEFSRGSSTPNAILKWDSTNKRFDFNNFPVRLQNSLLVSGTASSTIAGPLWVTGTPTGTGVSNSSLYINPASASTDYALFTVAVNNVERFRIDAEGDISIRAALGIENYLYHIGGDTLTIDDKLQVNGNEIKDNGGITRIALGATNTITGDLAVSGGISGTSLNVGAGTITSGLINGQDISATANFTGSINIGTTLTATGGLTTLSELLLTGSSTLQNFTFANATGTSATTTNFFSTNFGTVNFSTTDLLFTNATGTTLFATTASSTNLFSTLGNIGSLTTGALTTGSLSATGASSLQGLTFVNATGTSATTTNFYTANLRADVLSLTDLIFNRATGTAATTTSFFSTTASSTNLFSSLLTVGGNTLVTTAAGNVGIGTTNPQAKLGINQTSSTSNQLLLSNNTDAAGSYQQIKFQYSQTDASFGSAIRSVQPATSANGGSLSFLTDDTSGLLTERMRINQYGNVGIGTASPASYASYVALTIGDTSATKAGLLKFRSNYNSGNGAEIYQDALGDTRFNVNSSSTAMTIANNAMVGIGTESPDTTLHVLGGNGQGPSYPGQLEVADNSALAAGIGGKILFGYKYTGTGAYTYGPYIGAAKSNATDGDSAGDLVFATRVSASPSAERMRILSNGNVGIGTTSPSTKLHVYGTSGVQATLDASSGQYTQLDLRNANVQKAVLYYDNTNNRTSLYNAAGGTLLLNTDAGGNVGIGTSNPTGKLDVNGYIRAMGNTAPTSGAGVELAYSSGGYVGAYDRGASTYQSMYYYGNQHKWDVSGSVKMILDSSGNVGIGTTSPITKLHVEGSGTGTSVGTAFAAVTLGNSNSTANNWVGQGYYGSNNSGYIGYTGFQITDHTNKYGDYAVITRGSGGYSEKLRVTSDGNVGIGTSPTAAKLQVAGDITMSSGNWYYGLNVSAANQPLIRSRGMGYSPVTYPGVQVGQTGDHIALFIDPNSVTGGSFNGSSNEVFLPNNVRFMQANAGGTDWIYNTGGGTLTLDNGNVGVGIVNPGYELTVRSNVAAADDIFGILADDNGAVMVVAKDASDNGFMSIYDGSGNANVNLSSSGVSYFNGGNVGINKASPGAKLEVAGESTISYPTPGTTKGTIHISPSVGTNGNTSSLTFGGNGGTVSDMAHAGIYVQSSSAYGAKMYLATTDDYGTGSKARMMIDYNGNVGIGNTNPEAKLHISSGDGSVALFGPSATYGSTLRVGYYTASLPANTAQVTVSSNNIHIDAASGGGATYLNYFSGTGGVIFGNGAAGANASVSAAGVYSGGGLNVGTGTVTAGTGSFTGSITFNQDSTHRHAGVIGTYSPNSLAAIWSMGSPYQIAADGSNGGTLYGLNYSYEPDYAGAGTNPGARAGLGHQMQWRANGVTQTAIGTGVYTLGSVVSEGAMAFNTSIAGNGKLVVETTDNFLRLNQSNQFSSGIWLGTSNLRMNTGSIYVGSTGADGNVLITGNGDAARRITIDGGAGSGVFTSSVSAYNFADATGLYNVNLGSGNTEGRGLVAGFSGGSYGGIGYNVRHTASSATYIAPSTDTSSYLLFSGGGFVFQGAGAGAAGRSLSYSTLATINSSGHITANRYYTSGSPTYLVADGTTGIAVAGGTFKIGNYGTFADPGSAYSYGSLSLIGARNGYYGINFGGAASNANIMYDSAGNGGTYFESNGIWRDYYTKATNHWNINTSNDLGYTLGVNGEIYGDKIHTAGAPATAYNVNAGSIGAMTIYGYTSICALNSSALCSGSSGVVMGSTNTSAYTNFPASGNSFIGGSLAVGDTSLLGTYNLVVNGNSTSLMINSGNDDTRLYLSGTDRGLRGLPSNQLGIYSNSTANIVLDGFGNVGIGTGAGVNASSKLQVVGTTTTSALKLGNLTGTAGTCNSGAEGTVVYTRTATGYGDNYGRLWTCARNTNGVNYSWVTTYDAVSTANPDVAEFVPVLDESIEGGDVVVVSANPNSTAESIYDRFYADKYAPGKESSVIGIVSTDPGMIVNKRMGTPDAPPDTSGLRPLTLAGRVPVKITTENGVVKAGDYIAPSATVPGMAMKATSSGMVIGQVLNDYDASTGKALVLVGKYFYTAGLSLEGMDLRISSIETELGQATSSIAMLTETASTTVARLDALESLMASSTAFALDATTTQSIVASVLDAIGGVMQDGFLYVKALVAEVLQVGTAEKPAGITIFDTVTGEPFCISVVSGVQQTTPGKCALPTAPTASTSAPSTATVTIIDSQASSTGTSTDSTASSTPAVDTISTSTSTPETSTTSPTTDPVASSTSTTTTTDSTVTPSDSTSLTTSTPDATSSSTTPVTP